MLRRWIRDRRLAALEGLALVAVLMAAAIVVRRGTGPEDTTGLTGTAGSTEVAARLVGLVQGLSEDVAVAIWRMVTLLSGGPEAPWWRWALVEEGILALLVLMGAAVAATGLKVGAAALPSLPLVRWLPAVIVALPFGVIWTAYALLQSLAMNALAHPPEAREILALTWGLPLMLALPAESTAGPVVQFAVATAISTLVVLFTGEALMVVRNAGKLEHLQRSDAT